MKHQSKLWLLVFRLCVNCRKSSVRFLDEATVVSQPEQQWLCFDSYCYRGWLSHIDLAPTASARGSATGASKKGKLTPSGVVVIAPELPVVRHWCKAWGSLGWSEDGCRVTVLLCPAATCAFILSTTHLKGALVPCVSKHYFTGLRLWRQRCSGHSAPLTRKAEARLSSRLQPESLSA